LGISFLTILATFTGSILPSLSNLNDAYKELQNRITEKIQTDINITDISPSWWNSDWIYRRKLSFDNLNLKNFPVLVVLRDFNYSRVRSDGSDIRFILEDRVLNYEIELWNTSGESFIWVNVTYLGSGFIWMYYGNEEATQGENRTGTWKSSYGIVYHMDTNGNDSTSYNRDRVSDVGSPIPYNRIGYGLYFDGNDAWSQHDMEYWEKEWNIRMHEVTFQTSDDIASRQTIFAEDGAMMYILEGRLYSRWWSDSWGDYYSAPISANTTYHACMCYTYPGSYELYINGVCINSTTSSIGIPSHPEDGGIAFTGSAKEFHDGTFEAYFNGSIQEFRVLDTAEGETWIYASYLSITDQFIDYGEEESLEDVYLNITIKNAGSITLKTKDFTILVNGSEISFTSSKQYIYPGEEAVFVINVGTPGKKEIKVITGNGISKYKVFGEG
jgi:archaellum component FlaF (FlaF/FlaG flagellin family)